MNQEELKNYLINNDIDVQSAHAARMAADLAFRAYSESGKITGIDDYHIYCYFSVGNDGVFHQMTGKDDIKKVSKKLYDDYSNNPASLGEKIKRHQELLQEMDKLWEEYSNRNGKNVSDEFLGEYLEKIISIAYEWWKYGTIGEDKGEVVNWEVVGRFQKRHGISEEEAREAISVLAHPDEMAVFNQERKMFLEICLAIQQGTGDMEKIDGMIEKYISEFFWIKTNFYEATEINRKMVITDAENELRVKGEDGIKKELERINDNFKSIHNKKEELMKSYDFGKEDLADIEFSKTVIAWFDLRKLGMMKHFYYIYSMMREVSVRKGMDYYECTLYFTEELIALLKEDARLDPAVIAGRKKDLFFTFEKGRRIIYSDVEAVDIFDAVMAKDHSKDLKGVVASRGGKEKVRGVVNIVLRPDKNDFEEGKILVTSMTRIEFVPLMKKALAIVTNEGGLACHAAIVSREMGLPAIINTKNATKALKDGDEIEMDLKTGVIVKIT